MFADDSALIGYISDCDDAYSKEADHLMSRCAENNLKQNTSILETNRPPEH